jgi:hypothetical protein
MSATSCEFTIRRTYIEYMDNIRQYTKKRFGYNLYANLQCTGTCTSTTNQIIDNMYQYCLRLISEAGMRALLRVSFPDFAPDARQLQIESFSPA